MTKVDTLKQLEHDYQVSMLFRNKKEARKYFANAILLIGQMDLKAVELAKFYSEEEAFRDILREKTIGLMTRQKDYLKNRPKTKDSESLVFITEVWTFQYTPFDGGGGQKTIMNKAFTG